MKRKSQSINSSSDTYYADENIKRPKQEIRKRSSQTSSEVKERKKLYMRAYRLKKKNSDSSVMTRGVTSLKNGVLSQEMYLSEFKTRRVSCHQKVISFKLVFQFLTV